MRSLTDGFLDSGELEIGCVCLCENDAVLAGLSSVDVGTSYRHTLDAEPVFC